MDSHLLYTLLLLLFTLLFFWLLPGPLGAAAAVLPYAVAFIPLLPIVWYVAKKNVLHAFSIAPRYFDWGLFKKIFWYSIPITVTSFAWSVLVNTDTMVITYFRPLEETGLYNAALPIANILLFFPSSLMMVFFPIAAELWAKKRKDLLENAMAQAYRLIAAISIPGAVLFIIFPDVMLNILFGAKFVDAAVALRFLSLACIFSTFSMFNSSILSGIGKPKLMMYAVFTGAAFNLLFNIILVPRLGFVGAGIATLIAQFFIFLVSMYSIRHSIHFNFPWKAFILICVSGTIFTSVVWYLRFIITIHQLIKIPFILLSGFLLYVLLLFIFKAITMEEMKSLYARVRKRT